MPEMNSEQPSKQQESGSHDGPDQIKNGGKTAVNKQQKKIEETKNTGNGT